MMKIKIVVTNDDTYRKCEMIDSTYNFQPLDSESVEG